jgi:hypothetical protein
MTMAGVIVSLLLASRRLRLRPSAQLVLVIGLVFVAMRGAHP